MCETTRACGSDDSVSRSLEKRPKGSMMSEIFGLFSIVLFCLCFVLWGFVCVCVMMMRMWRAQEEERHCVRKRRRLPRHTPHARTHAHAQNTQQQRHYYLDETSAHKQEGIRQRAQQHRADDAAALPALVQVLLGRQRLVFLREGLFFCVGGGGGGCVCVCWSE